MTNNPRIIFFGTSAFAVPALEKMAGAEMRPLLVVTNPDAPAGRSGDVTPSPVKAAAERLGLEVFQPSTLRSPDVIGEFRRRVPDVGVLAAYGKIVPKEMLDLFPKGILNVHPSLLPRWRGPTPIQAAILAGDQATCVTIIVMDEEVDHGPIIAKSEIPIFKSETYSSLHDKLAGLGAELLVATLPKWLDGGLSPTPQDHAAATFCKKFTRESSKIDWVKSAKEIDRMVRALNPEPGVWTTYGTPPYILKIFAAEPFSNSQEFENGKTGEIFERGGWPAVRCGEGALLLKRVQPEGKKEMPGDAFLRGHAGIVGHTLG